MSQFFSFGRKTEEISDLREYVDIGVPGCVDFIITPLFKKNTSEEITSKRLRQGTKSSILLDVKTWTTKVVGQITDSVKLDDPSIKIQLSSEDNFKEELEWGYYLGVPSIFGPELNKTTNSNYASIISNYIQRKYTMPYWIPVDIQDPSTDDALSSWHRWNSFSSQLNFCPGVQPCLRLTAVQPSPDVINLWKGEPVDSIIIPSSLFIWGDDLKLSLPSYYEDLLIWYKYNRINRIIIEGPLEEECQQLTIIHNYLTTLFTNAPPLDMFERQIYEFNEVVQIPLQPLMDNLQSATYDVFEKDHVKYQLYEQAIYEVLSTYKRQLTDNRAYYTKQGQLLPSSSTHAFGEPLDPTIPSENRIIITLVGAGRGPLILASLYAAKKAKRDIIIYAIEKNHNAIVTLHSLHESLQWKDQVEIIECDMRKYQPVYYSDIILSELLGSFADNELSPECLIGAQRFIIQEGIFIPRDSTSFMGCCMSSRIWNNIKKVNPLLVSIPLESSYVVKIHNATLLSDIQPVFTFNHPDQLNGDFRRYTEVCFNAHCDGTIHGFSGYFESHLSDHVLLSIAPRSHSNKLVSWFPLFFPITTPFDVKKGDCIKVHIWRRKDDKRVWYEWCVVEPIITKIHNVNGKSQWIGL